ncbi:signal recognition particle-docking protein FtsY [Sulfitobacter sp. JBTF-M27]|uniref:Signal recognition particle receptor FtsY n=1 Tax=Sulfitobacter sediminilitoris TaxID=2698830 RepID=A0A6P0CA00_9RHOB|nr:signal recognition particle-docking protein FtsY [Sulfitobacter sediminilitoris]NEK21164.1 signal recognition particle-docking protein FtsY [Sulfitobacter sediminilitoris]
MQKAADEEARKAAEAAAREAEAARAAEEERQAEERRLAEEARAVDEARRAEEREEAEAAARAAAERQAAEERDAEEQARKDAAAKAARDAEARAAREAAQDEAPEPSAPEPLRTTMTPVAPDLVEEDAGEPAAKPGLLGRLMGRAAPKTVVRRVLDDDMLEQLEELLITADMGVDTALRVTANMAEGRFGKKLSVAEIKQLMADEIARIMEPVARPLPLYPKTPQVVLVVGVNGSGKTTTIGKLASQFRAAGKKVVIAAGDTFRAAAVEQLQVWGERAGVPVLTAAQGSDPASLVFDAMGQAQADGADLLLIDTAGRLQNRGDLMEELAKIVRVIRKKDETAPHNTLLVLDATTGQNAINQVKVFQEISDVSGLVMTKLDGTAKGGVLVALADKFGLPIHAIGVGEQIDDLSPFDPQEFADALVGYER